MTSAAQRRPRLGGKDCYSQGRGLPGTLLALLLVLTIAPPAPAATESSELEPLAAKSLLLAVARAGDRLIAVGDRGHVLVSRDEGRTWTQIIAPTRAMLTGVSFPDAQHGWAVGHDGVIMATSNGGQSWVRQDSGHDLTTIYLDVLFRDSSHGIAVGAYGKFQVTSDGGRSWHPLKLSPDEVHFNRVSESSDGSLYLAGESGTVLVSSDSGSTWVKADPPYDGSLFGILPLPGGRIVAYGLRGHILRSDDRGKDWVPVRNEVKVLIMGGTALRNGTIVLGGQGGNFFLSRDEGLTFTPWQPEGFGTSVAAVIGTTDGALLAVGEAGITRLPLP